MYKVIYRKLFFFLCCYWLMPAWVTCAKFCIILKWILRLSTFLANWIIQQLNLLFTKTLGLIRTRPRTWLYCEMNQTNFVWISFAWLYWSALPFTIVNLLNKSSFSLVQSNNLQYSSKFQITLGWMYKLKCMNLYIIPWIYLYKYLISSFVS